jgi:hypothetical protein
MNLAQHAKNKEVSFPQFQRDTAKLHPNSQ